MRTFLLFLLIVFISAKPMSARQMECHHDFITHLTTLYFTDHGSEDGSIFYRFVHSVSPTGGEDMFIFDGRDLSALQGGGEKKHIMGHLFFDPSQLISSIDKIDFDLPAYRQLQFPESYFENSSDVIQAPLVTWSCRRMD